MKKNIFIALFFTAFMLPIFGNMDTAIADELGSYGCHNADRKTHVDCLRSLLDSTPYGLTVAKGSRGLGNYGCGNQPRIQHVNCLRGLLDQHGAHLQVGNHGGGASGTHPPADISHCATLPPDTRPQCEAAAHGGPPPGGQHNGPPPGGHEGDPSAACAAIPHPDGSAHVDPPEAKINDVEEEYKANCQAGACSLSEATYASLESLGHSRGEIDCFLAAGERQHNEEHGGNHPPAGNP